MRSLHECVAWLSGEGFHDRDTRLSASDRQPATPRVGGSLHNLLFAFLSRDWAGLVMAAVVGALGVVLAGIGAGAAWLIWFGAALVILALVMAAGAIWHLVYLARVRRRFPPPGRMIDVGGYRLHFFAEGEPSDLPPVVWIPGGHGGAYGFHNLHRRLRSLTRSILIDRPGAMWSDVGPFPCRTATEANALTTALERSGEKGPFVFVGHSLGGLLAANIAKRRPDLTAAVVLLDATHQDMILFGPRSFVAHLARVNRWQRRQLLFGACRKLFGLHDARTRQPKDDAALDEVSRKLRQDLGSEVLAAGVIEVRAGAALANASIYEELYPRTLLRIAEETVVYDRDLGDLPVYVVAPKDEGLEETLGSSDTEQVKLCLFSIAVRDRYLAASSRSHRIYSSKGTGHNFPYQEPDFVADIVRDAVHDRVVLQPDPASR